MKKFLVLSLVFLSSILGTFAMSSVAMAVTGGPCDSNNIDVAGCLKAKESELKGVITAKNDKSADYTVEGGLRAKIVSVTNNLLTIIAVLAIGAIVMGGFFMVTAYGDDEKIKKGKTSLKFAVLGLVVAMLSFGIVNAVVTLFYSAGK